MFSVIIPLYNKESSILNTIQSVLGQSFTNFEIIIINDGSTDNSVEKINQIKDDRIRLIHQGNQGVSVARNRGIKEAKYDWVCFLDADDLWKENHLKEYERAIKENIGLNWILSGYTTASVRRKINMTYIKHGILNDVYDDLSNNLSIHTSAVCVQVSIFKENPEIFFREGLNRSEDREVWYKLGVLDNQPYYIQKSLSIYNIDVENSLTKNNENGNGDHFLTMQNRIEQFEAFKRLPKAQKTKIRKFIVNKNKKLIGSRYVRGKFKIEHKEHLKTSQYYLLYLTSSFPLLIRKIINKVMPS